MSTLKKIIIVLICVCSSFLDGQVNQTRPEIIPYRLVPSQAMGYGCWLEIEVIWGVEFQQDTWQNQVMKVIIMERVVFEETNTWATNDIFQIDDKEYLLLRLPNTAGLNDWGWDRMNYETK